MKMLNSAALQFILLSFLFPSISFSQLKSNSNQADYLIIIPSKYVNTTQKFIEWKRNKGFNVRVVELNQIYSEFPDSSKSHSIRDFTSYAIQYWQKPKIKYILLIGNGHDLPSYKVKSSFYYYTPDPEDSVSIDGFYVTNQYDGDLIPDAAIGRFAVNNEIELKNIIKKTIYFSDSLSFNDYDTKFSFITDLTNSSDFNNSVNQFITNTVSNFSTKTIFANEDTSIFETKTRLFNSILEGTLFLSYFGHGTTSQWSKYGIMTTDDIDTLSTSLPFLLITASCAQNFDTQDSISIVQKLLAKGNGGSVASFTSTGLTFLSLGSNIEHYFVNYILNNPSVSIGEAILSAKRSLLNENSPIDVGERRYTLLGDPSLVINRKIASANASKNLPLTFVLKQNYPNPFNPSTKINYSISSSSYVKLIVYDILGKRVSTIFEGFQQKGNYSFNWSPLNLSSGVYFYRLEVTNYNGYNNYSNLKKMIFLK